MGTRHTGDILLVMAGRGSLGWDPQGWLSRLCLPAWGACGLAPACESVAVVCLGGRPAEARVLTTRWSDLHARYVAWEMPLEELLQESDHVLVWPVALNRLDQGAMDRAKAAAMSKPDVPAATWLRESTGMNLRDGPGDGPGDGGGDWCMELALFLMHRIGATVDHGGGSSALVRSPISTADALSLNRFCELEESPQWLPSRGGSLNTTSSDFWALPPPPAVLPEAVPVAVAVAEARGLPEAVPEAVPVAFPLAGDDDGAADGSLASTDIAPTCAYDPPHHLSHGR